MLSESSSHSFSHASMTDSIFDFCASVRVRDSRAFSSLSKTLTEYQRRSFSLTEPLSSFEIVPIAFSTFASKVAAFTETFPDWLFLPSSIARAITSFTPSFFRALISYTGQPSFLLSSAVSIRSPFFLTRSIILTATTTGMPSSMS